METVSWICTMLVLTGYYLNSQKRYLPAMLAWIVGDIGWIAYDLYIDNISHMVLSIIIICLNLIGIYKIIKE